MMSHYNFACGMFIFVFWNTLNSNSMKNLYYRITFLTTIGIKMIGNKDNQWTTNYLDATSLNRSIVNIRARLVAVACTIAPEAWF